MQLALVGEQFQLGVEVGLVAVVVIGQMPVSLRRAAEGVEVVLVVGEVALGDDALRGLANRGVVLRADQTVEPALVGLLVALLSAPVGVQVGSVERHPDAQPRAARLQGIAQRREALRVELLLRHPYRLAILPTIIGHKGVHLEAVGIEQVLLETLKGGDEVLDGQLIAAPVVPTVVLEEVAAGSADGVEVVAEGKLEGIALCPRPDHRSLADDVTLPVGLASGKAREVRERHEALALAGLAAGVFEAGEPGLADEDGLAPPAAVARKLCPESLDLQPVHGLAVLEEQPDAFALVGLVGEEVHDVALVGGAVWQLIAREVEDVDLLLSVVLADIGSAFGPEVGDGEFCAVHEADEELVAFDPHFVRAIRP